LNPNGDYKMDDLLREAIADAKAVRETALANAKIALEEAFTPRLQSMLSKKIASEVEDSDEEMDTEEEMEDSEEMRMDTEEEMEDSEEMRDAEEMEDAEEMRDAEEMEDAEEEMRDAEEDEEMDESEDKEETEDSEEMREEEDAEEDEEIDEMEDKEEDELDLESVLAELEKDLDDEDQVDEMEDKDEEDKVDEVEDKEEDDKVDENDVSSDIGKSDNKVNPKANDSTGAGQGPEGEGSDKKAGTELGDHTIVKEEEDAEESDLDLDEVLKALTEEEDAEEADTKVDELQKEIKEYRKVVNFMRKNLNEVNLLNAKLLFSNKLFRAFGLNNNQKLKVVETFDRTKNLREVKLVYATLAESFKRPGKLSESVKKGSSSKPTRSTKPAKAQVLSEGQELKARFKKLANIL
jgi:hypothetical protein